MMYLSKISFFLVLSLGLFYHYFDARPKLFVVGDSISMQYGPYLQQYLEGKFIYDRKRGVKEDSGNVDMPKFANGGDSGMVLAYLKIKLKTKEFQPDTMLINCGLNEIKTDMKTGKKQVEIVPFKNNLEQIHALLANKSKPMIWLRTTVVEDVRHNSKQQSFHRYTANVANEVADYLFKALNVPIIDLHHFILNLGEDLFIDHVHFCEDTRAKQAAFIGVFLEGMALKD